MGYYIDVTDNVCDGWGTGSRYVTTREWVEDDKPITKPEPKTSRKRVRNTLDDILFSGIKLAVITSPITVPYGLYKLGEYLF